MTRRPAVAVGRSAVPAAAEEMGFRPRIAFRLPPSSFRRRPHRQPAASHRASSWPWGLVWLWLRELQELRELRRLAAAPRMSPDVEVAASGLPQLRRRLAGVGVAGRWRDHGGGIGRGGRWEVVHGLRWSAAADLWRFWWRREASGRHAGKIGSGWGRHARGKNRERLGHGSSALKIGHMGFFFGGLAQ
jgi:hypothetical protein